MRIIKRACGYTYMVTCPHCGSELEAEANEIKIRPQYNDAWFECPVCENPRCCVALSKVIKRVKFATNDEKGL